MDIQEYTLKNICKQYSEAGTGLFIADRAPIDLIAYTLADIQRTPLSDTMEERVHNYIEKCFDAMNRFFALVVVVQPGIPLVADPTKAPIGKSYIEHLSHLIFGIVISERIAATHYYIPRHQIDMDERVRLLKTAYQKTIEKQSKLMGLDFDTDEVILTH